MIPAFVVQNNRQLGKTERIMHEIHEFMLAGRRRDVLVVLPAMSHLYFWKASWDSLFPQMPMPDYVTMTSRERVRGRQFAKIYVEDIDTYQEGIYDPALWDLWPALRSPHGGEEVVFTSSTISLNQKSHNVVHTPASLKQRYLRGRR